MKRTRFSLITDSIFYAVCAFLPAFCIARYYGAPFWLAAFPPLLLSVGVGIGIYAFGCKKSNRRALGKKQEEEKQKLMLHLALEKSDRVRAALLRAYTADGGNTELSENTLYTDGKVIAFFFTLEPVSADSVAAFIRKYEQNFIFVCNTLGEEAKKLLFSFQIQTICADEIYALFLRTDTMPSPLICGDIPRRTAKQRLQTTFSKKNARPFFISGVLLFLMSLFVFFPVYYIISGGVLLICAAAIRLFGCPA